MGTEKKKKARAPRTNWLKVIVEDYSKRINKGVRFLDQKFGRKVWLAKIDETALRLADGNMCVLGQAYGEFWEEFIDDDGDHSKGEVSGGLSTKQAAERGFYLDDNLNDERYESTPHGFDGYDILTHLWHCRIVGLKIEAGITLAAVE